jgi:hypothetical protein
LPQEHGEHNISPPVFCWSAKLHLLASFIRFYKVLRIGKLSKALKSSKMNVFFYSINYSKLIYQRKRKNKISFYNIKLIYADSYVPMMEAEDLSEMLVSIYQAILSHTTRNRKASHSQPRVPQITASLYEPLLKRETKFDPCKVMSKLDGYNFGWQ